MCSETVRKTPLADSRYQPTRAEMEEYTNIDASPG